MQKIYSNIHTYIYTYIVYNNVHGPNLHAYIQYFILPAFRASALFDKCFDLTLFCSLLHKESDNVAEIIWIKVDGEKKTLPVKHSEQNRNCQI